MTRENDAALRGIAEAEAWLRSLPAGPVPLPADYLARVARIELDARNAPGSDKTWLAPARDQFREELRAGRASH